MVSVNFTQFLRLSLGLSDLYKNIYLLRPGLFCTTLTVIFIYIHILMLGLVLNPPFTGVSLETVEHFTFP